MNSTLKYTYQGKPLLHYCKENSLNYRNVVYRICSGIPIEQAIKKDLVLKKGKPKMKQEFKDEIYSLYSKLTYKQSFMEKWYAIWRAYDIPEVTLRKIVRENEGHKHYIPSDKEQKTQLFKFGRRPKDYSSGDNNQANG